MYPLEKGTIGFYLIDYVTFVIVDNTTDNIVNIVTELPHREFLRHLVLGRVSTKRKLKRVLSGRQK